MRRNNRRKWYVNLFFLLALNLFFFFSLNLLFTHSNLLPSKTLTQNHRHLSTQSHHFLTKNRHSLPQTLPNGASVTLHGQPWPILPSFLPWLQNPPPRPKSCEGYFGNGFTRRIDLLRPPEGSLRLNDFGSSSGEGWFRCFYSETLQSSICEGGRIRMVPGRIRMSAGGEKLTSVIGRSEWEELPEFESGAFEIQVGKGFGGSRKIVSEEFLDRFVPRGLIGRHTMRDLMGSINAVELDDTELRCHEWVEDTTLFVTRFEYANLFHTVTDWYSAYVASRVAGLPNRPHLVFIDGHCKAPLEETWKALFSTIRYAKNFTSSVCFRHAVISPLGYETALFKGLSEPIDCQGGPAHELWENPDDTKTARLSEFGEMLRAAFGLPLDKHRIHKRTTAHNVLFIRREDYLAHPRHGGKVESRLSNEQEVFDALKTWASTYSKCHVNLVNGLFAHMPMKEQFRAIQDASVIIGAHGAGLTHVIAAMPKTVVLEIISSLYKRPHFELISKWRGLEYHAIDLPASVANPTTVREKLRSILRNFGC